MQSLENDVFINKSKSVYYNDFVQKHKSFILNCAGKHTNRYITDSDDEYSVSLSAFAEAVESYDKTKGGFLSFAEQIIKRRLTDYYRAQKKYSSEIQVDPHVFDTEPEEDCEDVPLRIMVAEKISYVEDNSLKYEIEAANEVFKKFGFRFFDLAECSPKADKTKTACSKAVICILKDHVLKAQLYEIRQLPIKKIEKISSVPRKILDRHRKYIIAAVEILSGGYPNLSEYMRTIRKEIDK